NVVLFPINPFVTGQSVSTATVNDINRGRRLPMRASVLVWSQQLHVEGHGWDYWSGSLRVHVFDQNPIVRTSLIFLHLLQMLLGLFPRIEKLRCKCPALRRLRDEFRHYTTGAVKGLGTVK